MPKSTKKPLKKVVATKLNIEDHKKLEETIKHSNLTLSQVLRNLILEYLLKK